MKNSILGLITLFPIIILVGCGNDSKIESEGSELEKNSSSLIMESASSNDKAKQSRISESNYSYGQEYSSGDSISESSSNSQSMVSDQPDSYNTTDSSISTTHKKLSIFDILNVEGRNSKNDKEDKSFIAIGINKNDSSLDLSIQPQTIKIKLEKFREQNSLIGLTLFESNSLLEKNNDLRVAVIDKDATFLDYIDENTEKEFVLSTNHYYYLQINPGGMYDLKEHGILEYIE